MNAPAIHARHWLLGGRVQGVGFRPFVYRLAMELGLTGWVRNQSGAVEIVAQGVAPALAEFARRLAREQPPLAQGRVLARTQIALQPFDSFDILPSAEAAGAHTCLPPDYAPCAQCLAELHDPQDRRFHYPFINCTQCGPRYTVIRCLPYDRAHTTLADFPLCPRCAREYHNPTDRRFHAQPTACPQCGPQLHFSAPGAAPVYADTALDAAVAALRQGRVLAVKGVGGYHLLCDARNAAAIAHLRARKPRPHKPLAVMLARVPSGVSASCQQILQAPSRPILLISIRYFSDLPVATIAPGLREIGVLLSYSPLHELLLDAIGGPLIATSANPSGEPVLTEETEAEARLGHVAEAFLHHNRPIARPADDTVMRVIAGRARPLRLGRGLVPLELALPWALPTPTLAVGGQYKNTVALGFGRRAVISAHIGDLDSPRGMDLFMQTIDDLQTLYQTRAQQIITDAHPDYQSTRWAKSQSMPMRAVFHHHAHASALVAECRGGGLSPPCRCGGSPPFDNDERTYKAGINRRTDRAGINRRPYMTGINHNWLVFTWDGVGLGPDGTLWGGEGLLGRPGQWRRVASFRPFALPGGELAARQPWRSAAALWWEAGLPWDGWRPACVSANQYALAYAAWQQGINCPRTTAAGRLFDAAAALIGVVETASFEGHGPMWLESLAHGARAPAPPCLPLVEQSGVWVADWQPLLPWLRAERLTAAQRAAGFHRAMSQVIVDQALAVRAAHGVHHVGLCGGVMQNRYLTETAQRRLQQHGFTVFIPSRVPLNDAGLCFGQLVEAAAVGKVEE